jgi:hypothetical protein
MLKDKLYYLITDNAANMLCAFKDITELVAEPDDLTGVDDETEADSESDADSMADGNW